MIQMNFLVTGGAGCIGSELVKTLLNNHRVTVLDNLSSGKMEHIENFFNNKNFKFVEIDITETDISDYLDGIETVFHLAANPDIKFTDGDPTNKDLKQNTIATYGILDAMRKKKVKNIVFSSSSVVYGHAKQIPTPENYGPYEPTSLYGASKLACEGLVSAYCNMFGMKGWVFRFANIVGDKSRKKGRTVISDFILKLKHDSHRLEILGDGKQWKSYLLVDECINGMLFAFEHAKDRLNIFNLGTSDSITVDTIANVVIDEMGLDDVKITYTGNTGGWSGDITKFLLDVGKMKNLGWGAKYMSEQAVRIATRRMLGKGD